MSKDKVQFICDNCGYISTKYLGRCPNCGSWNKFAEHKIMDFNSINDSEQVCTLNKINVNKDERVKTSIKELDRVLGGGIVPGSLILIGGDPGIGKSTLLLQISKQIQSSINKVLYISGEESVKQIKLRANRLNVNENNIYILSETNISIILNIIHKISPKYLIIDSIQTMNDENINSSVGSITQIRTITSKLMKIAKEYQITIFIVGHVTKDGSIAGPKVLEHMVDTVLYFEGDMHHSYRILHSIKNRFGSTNEIGMFEMKNDGLHEVKNPSEVFLEERLIGTTGSAIVASLEGSRPILVEIQALIVPTSFGNPKRTSTGIDYNRISVIMAVLEKRAHLMLQNKDAYLKITGGVKLDEPAIDLAIAVAIASSYKNCEIESTDCFIGEIGLTGEIRRVNNIDQRIMEASKLGFKRIFIPKHNLNDLNYSQNVNIFGVLTLSEALKIALKS